MPLVRRLDQELKATAMVSAPRLKHIRHIILGGFLKAIPSNLKLWEVQGSNEDCVQSESTVQTIIRILTVQVPANKEQVEAVKKAFDAPAGFSLVHGGPNTGKTTVVMLQALTAVASGHKVLISVPEKGKAAILAKFGKGMPRLPNSQVPKIYLANPTQEDRISFSVFEFACALRETDEKPVSPHRHTNRKHILGTNTNKHTLSWAVLQAAKADAARLLKPQNQALLNFQQEYYPFLQPLADSYQFLALLNSISDASSEAEKAQFHVLCKKLLFRTIGEADIIISSCQDAGNEDLYLNFEPTVVIIDKATEVAETETFIPLLMYHGVRFRIFVGNRYNIRLPPEEPWSPGLAQHQMTLFARMELNGVPVHALKTRFPQKHGHSKSVEVPFEQGSTLSTTPTVKLKDLPNRRCKCGSGKMPKNCGCKAKTLTRSVSVPGRRFVPMTPVLEEHADLSAFL